MNDFSFEFYDLTGTRLSFNDKVVAPCGDFLVVCIISGFHLKDLEHPMCCVVTETDNEFWVHCNDVILTRNIKHKGML
jgi:hypothetical protein